IPDGWSKHVHPEGTPYYFLNKIQKSYTEFDICNPIIQKHIEWFCGYLWNELLGDRPNSENFELVVELHSKEEGVVCPYYFVNHIERCLFWSDDYNEPGFLLDCQGVNSLSHKKFGVEAEYWLHWDRFPAYRVVTKELVRELKGLELVNRSNCLHIASDGGNVPRDIHHDHSVTIIGNCLPSVHQATSNLWFQGRIMHYFSKNKYINFHGQDCVRLRDDQTVHGWKYEPSWFMVFAAPALLMAPVTNIRSLHKLYVDHLVRMDKWTAFVNDFTSQLQNTNLLATVLLTTNVGFLAIQSVDSSTSRSVRQITSYLSIVCSLASIVIGLIFLERSRHDRSNSVDKTAKLLDRFYHAKHGLERLALIFSLPYAYLMWGMIFFFVAFLAECYAVGNVILRACLGGGMFLFGIPAALSIWASRENRHHWWWEVDHLQPVLPGSEVSPKDVGEVGEVPRKKWFSIGKYIFRGQGEDVAIELGNRSTGDENQHAGANSGVVPGINIRQPTT
ncbi:hypothetical protein BU15DRAFT_44841, partial [Melanogaster broomeanus]